MANKSIFAIVMFLGLATACSCNVPCDSSDEQNLGTVSYSAEFQAWNLEDSTQALAFTRGATRVTLDKLPQGTTTARLLVREICTSLDIKPFTAYEFYEYDNRDKVFSTGGYLINITAEIAGRRANPSESIFINLSRDGQATIKGVIPVTNPQATVPEAPVGLFQLNASLNIGGQNFTNVWSYEADGLGIYYQQQNGIVALQTRDGFYFRD